jgi:hypothetical protein
MTTGNNDGISADAQAFGERMTVVLREMWRYQYDDRALLTALINALAQRFEGHDWVDGAEVLGLETAYLRQIGVLAEGRGIDEVDGAVMAQCAAFRRFSRTLDMEDGVALAYHAVRELVLRLERGDEALVAFVDNYAPDVVDGPAEAVLAALEAFLVESCLGERQASYGHPNGNFANIAEFVALHLEAHCKLNEEADPISPVDIAVLWIGFKVARRFGSPKLDTTLDTIGYLFCVPRIWLDQGDPRAAAFIDQYAPRQPHTGIDHARPGADRAA